MSSNCSKAPACHGAIADKKPSASACSKATSPQQENVYALEFWTANDAWRRAGANTLRCLVGCSLGDLSALWLLQAYAPEIGVVAATAASCAAGITTSMLLETVVLRATERMPWTTAWRTAAGMSLISMLAMELAENAVELSLCGGNVVSGPAFWQALPFALAAGYLVPLPYNYYVRSALASPTAHTQSSIVTRIR